MAPGLGHLSSTSIFNQIKYPASPIGSRNPNVAHDTEVPAEITLAVAVIDIPVSNVFPMRAVRPLQSDPAFKVSREFAELCLQLRLDVLRYIPLHEPAIVPFAYRHYFRSKARERGKLAAGDAETFAGAEVDVVLVDASEGVSLAGGTLAGLGRMKGGRAAVELSGDVA